MIRSIFLLLLLLSTPLFAEPIKVTVPGNRTVGMNPLTIRLQITLEPNEANRWVCLYVKQTYGGTQEKNSCWDVDAEREAKTTWRLLKDLTTGKWEIVAAVVRQDEKSVLSNRLLLTVLGPGYESPE